MKRARGIRALAGAAVVTVLFVALGAVFRAYLNPDNLVQWLVLLQLCR